MRSIRLIIPALLFSVSFSFALAQDTPTPSTTQKDQKCVAEVQSASAGQLQLTLSECGAKPTNVEAEFASNWSGTSQTPPKTKDGLFSRTGYQPWHILSVSSPSTSIIPISTSSRLLLLGRGDCVVAGNAGKLSLCYPVALMVQTSQDISSPNWKQLLRWDGGNLRIVDSLDQSLASPGMGSRVLVNGNSVDKTWEGKVVQTQGEVYVQVFDVPSGCRYYSLAESTAPADTIDIRVPATPDRGLDNGITVGNPKIFDTFALRQKLNVVATQLASISAFNAAQITGQYGTLQGISRDTSYFAAQITTSPTPSVVSTVAGATGNLVTTANQANTATTNLQATCPTGYIPSLATGNSVSCTQVTVTPQQALPVNVLTTTANPATTQTVTTADQPTSQTQTTTPSLTATVPVAPVLTPIAAPTNTGVSSGDMLNEQFQLSAQLLTLQMLLQGASSDQILLSQERAFGVRAQTTLGFPITIQTPKCFHDAVAEVRILVLPKRAALTSQPKLSIINLLPAQKTYNVAKVTSKADQFGAAVAIQAISLGFSTGKSKDRLYLAKDTDTVALEYTATSPLAMGEEDVPEGDCGDLPKEVMAGSDLQDGKYDFNSAVMFGWQFRPVLGAPAVTDGQRTTFAQLALPSNGQDNFTPSVWIQTRWRHYDQKKQIVGNVHENSCGWKHLAEPVSIIDPIVVKDVQVIDTGQGLLRFRASGDFFASSGQIRSGSLSVVPQFFDGSTIEYFTNAKDLLSNGDLRVLDEALHGESLVIPQKQHDGQTVCRITNQRLMANPLPDGNSSMQLDYDRQGYDPAINLDGYQHPLVLLGTDVYGLRDKPMTRTSEDCQSTGQQVTHCKFTFVAPTEAVRAAKNFLVRDPAWDAEGATGTVAFGPEFTKVESISKPPTEGKDPPTTSKPPTDKPQPQSAPSPTWYVLTGRNFSTLKTVDLLTGNAPASCTNAGGCLQILADATPVPKDNIAFVSDTSIWLKLHQPKTLQILWSNANQTPAEWDIAVTDTSQKSKISADPGLLYVSDSQAVTFTGMDFSKVTSVSYEGKLLQLPSLPTKTKIVVQVTTAVTGKFGHKELLANLVDGNGKPATVALPIDVVQR
jgi:hypothetical protein